MLAGLADQEGSRSAETNGANVEPYPRYGETTWLRCGIYEGESSFLNAW